MEERLASLLVVAHLEPLSRDLPLQILESSCARTPWGDTFHSSYSEGNHCPLSLSEGPKARTFFSLKGRRPALYFTVSLSEGPQARIFFSVIPQRPALYFTVSLSDSSKPAPSFTVPLSEMQLVRTVTQWAAPKPATSITV